MEIPSVAGYRFGNSLGTIKRERRGKGPQVANERLSCRVVEGGRVVGRRAVASS